MPFDFGAVADLLRCPISQARLIRRDDRLISLDAETRRAYPIVDDIAKLVPDEGETLSEEEWRTLTGDASMANEVEPNA